MSDQIDRSEKHPAFECMVCGRVHAGNAPQTPKAITTPRLCFRGSPAGAARPSSWDKVPHGATYSGLVIATPLPEGEIEILHDRFRRRARICQSA
jgi:hypothetical protein